MTLTAIGLRAPPASFGRAFGSWSADTPEVCRKQVPGKTVCTRRPWLQLDILVQAHAALRDQGSHPWREYGTANGVVVGPRSAGSPNTRRAEASFCSV